ncbi:uncharacterized protein N7484_010368 [Penicillium longicatenatum]|uniref:uncharacterized protein n=1 Tax=Penicillium longicatenatum TaxID=1561947 RepID=UPI002549A4C4|nr:uncharacterized protein N7484_010368 [Penicillium longicatenatum]KAJ5630268.1 hypothetical protein N7484_010368 [Penicillium longicatenatum]
MTGLLLKTSQSSPGGIDAQIATTTLRTRRDDELTSHHTYVTRENLRDSPHGPEPVILMTWVVASYFALGLNKQRIQVWCWIG